MNHGYGDHATVSGAAHASQSAVHDEDDKYATRTFNIFQLIINETLKKKSDLKFLMENNNINIPCLQENKLNQKMKFEINSTE